MEKVTKLDLAAAFKALDELEIPQVDGIKHIKDLQEAIKTAPKADAIVEDFYDIGNKKELEAAEADRSEEIAKAKLAKIEKIVDLDADSPEDLQPSYVGKTIIQCPQCMTLFYKNEQDLEPGEEDKEVVNVGEACQHCGNVDGYTIIGKVAKVPEEELTKFNAAEAKDNEKPKENTELNLDDQEEKEIEADKNELNDESEDEPKLTPVETKEVEQESITSKVADSLIEEYEEDTEETEEEPVSTAEITELEVIEDKPHEANENEVTFSADETKNIAKEAVETVTEAELDKKTNKIITKLVDDEVEDKKLENGNSQNEDEKSLQKIETTEGETIETIKESVESEINAFVAQLDSNNKQIQTDEKGLAEDTHSKEAQKEVDLEKIGEEAKKIANENKKPVIYGYCGTNHHGEKRYFELEPIICDDIKKCSQKVVNKYHPSGSILVVYPDTQINESNELEVTDAAVDKMLNSQEFKKPISENEINAIIATDHESKEPLVIDNLEEVQDDSLSECITNSLTNVYENVDSFTLTNCELNNKKFIVEGLIKFTSGLTKNTKYIFNEAIKNKNFIIFEGYNKDLAQNGRITLNCSVKDKTLIVESLTYKYNIGNDLVEGFAKRK